MTLHRKFAPYLIIYIARHLKQPFKNLSRFDSLREQNQRHYIEQQILFKMKRQLTSFLIISTCVGLNVCARPSFDIDHDGINDFLTTSSSEISMKHALSETSSQHVHDYHTLDDIIMGEMHEMKLEQQMDQDSLLIAEIDALLKNTKEDQSKIKTRRLRRSTNN